MLTREYKPVSEEEYLHLEAQSPIRHEYVLISQDEARVEIHRRCGDIGWEKIEYSGPETVELTSVGLQIGMREIYDGVPIEALMRGPGQP